MLGALCLAAALGSAFAAPRLELVAPSGDPVRGQETRLLAVISDGGAPVDGAAPIVATQSGQVLGAPERVEPGVWALEWRAPDQGDRATLVVEAEGARARIELPLQAPPGPALVAPERMTAAADGVTVEIRLQAPEALDPARVEVSAPEGRVESVSAEGAELIVRWTPGDDPFPRAVPLAFRDTRRPEAPPAWTVVSLRGRPRVPVQTSPGARVTLRVAGRNHGPFVAGADGVANASLEVRPGETTAEVIVLDAAGNTQKSTLVLGAARPPTLALVPMDAPVAGRPLPPLALLALDGAGEPWAGVAPTCRSSLGDAALQAMGAGRWRVQLAEPGDAPALDLTVECNLGAEARQTRRLALLSGPPTAIVLRVWPIELTAELPVATLDAHLVNALGDRVPAAGIELAAERGELVGAGPTAVGGARAEYRGEAAIGATDTLRAAWSSPPGDGGVVELDVSARPTATGLTLWGRALDRQGRPVEGASMRIGLGGATARATTDRRGWASVEVATPPDAGPWIVEVQAGDRVRRAVLFAGCALGRDPAAPDLVATTLLPVRAGRVAEVFVSTEPRTVTAGRGARARVKVVLQDRGGHPVTDEPIALAASLGQISQPELRADGSFEAIWSAPETNTYGEVRITVSRGDQQSTDPSSSDFAASTTLELQPRPTRGAVGVAGGMLVGPDELASPWVQLDLDLRVSGLSVPLYGRLSMATYGVSVTGADPITGESLDLSLRLVPVSAGALLRGERGRLAGHAGAALVVAPYQLRASFGDGAEIEGLGLPSPGLELMTGTALRVRTGEFTAEARYLLLSLDAADIGWQGSMGGLVGTLGYRLLY